MTTPDYKFNEGELIDEFRRYVDSTYSGHYAKDRNFQAAEFIFDSGHGIGFTIGNIMKYAQRYGHKGTPADYRKDMMKVIHYAFMALYEHDKKYRQPIQEFTPDGPSSSISIVAYNSDVPHTETGNGSHVEKLPEGSPFDGNMKYNSARSRSA